MCSELFPTTSKTGFTDVKRVKTLSANMPLTKVDDAERKARAARQALLSQDDAPSGLFGPKLGTQNSCVRSVRQVPRPPQMRWVKL